MNRRAEMTHVVYSGWMTKSPPEKKLTGPWKIFRAKWKRRYFVLSKPAQSLPGAYILNYFSDENCKKLKGYIDLDQCLEIIESLDSDQFRFLLAIKTTHKGKERTYFLATDTEEQMTTWVRNLCTVCGMKPEESGEPEPPRPPTREDHTAARSPPKAHNMTKTSPQTMNHTNRSSPSQRRNITPPPQRHAEPTSQSQRRPPPPVTTQPQSNNVRQGSEYIPLESCHSGPSIKIKTARQMSLDSVPDEIAPPPPVKTGDNDLDDNVFHQTYDVPPSAIMEDDIYKVPPPRPGENGRGYGLSDVYDIPPSDRNSPSTPRSSSSESQKGDSHVSQVYDIPPPRADELSKDDVYDVPPNHPDSLHNRISLDDVPPVRPPKPSNLISQTAQEPYMNLPNNSKVFTDLNKNIPVDIKSAPPPAFCAGMVNVANTYDIPLPDSARSVTSMDFKDTLLNSTPPPPAQCGLEHKYTNAAAGFVAEQDVYLPMDPVNVLPEPRKSSSTSNEVEYTDMSGKSSFDDSFESKSVVYDHPPVRPAPRSDQAPQIPKRPGLNPDVDTYNIYSTHRTRSFKKSSSSAGSPLVVKRVPPPVKTTVPSVPLPLNTREMRHPDFSTSDEDDDDVMGSPLWETTPPAPGSKENKESELKYIDLDHDDSVEQPMRSPVGASGAMAPTEYHEIDFVKTDALKTVRETTTKERQKQADS